MPPSEAPAAPGQKSRKLVIAVWASVILAVVVVVIGYLLLPRGLVYFDKFQPYTGQLIVFAETSWEAPTGEVVQGLLSYSPEPGTVSYLLPPSSGASVTPSAIFQNKLLTTRQSETSTDLVVVDAVTQEAEVIDSLPASEGVFGQAVWSSDGTQAAYVVYATGQRPALKVTGEDVAEDLGFNVPLAFPSAAGEVLLDTRPLLSAVNAATGERTDMEGAAFSSEGETVQVTPSGNFLIARLPEEKVARVYVLYWNEHMISTAGVLPMEEGSSLAFNENDQVLLTTEKGTSMSYQLSADGQHILLGWYDFKLPENVEIISWTTP